jgi:hypothetical protein
MIITRVKNGKNTKTIAKIEKLPQHKRNLAAL